MEQKAERARGHAQQSGDCGGGAHKGGINGNGKKYNKRQIKKQNLYKFLK